MVGNESSVSDYTLALYLLRGCRLIREQTMVGEMMHNHIGCHKEVGVEGLLETTTGHPSKETTQGLSQGVRDKILLLMVKSLLVIIVMLPHSTKKHAQN